MSGTSPPNVKYDHLTLEFFFIRTACDLARPASLAHPRSDMTLLKII